MGLFKRDDSPPPPVSTHEAASGPIPALAPQPSAASQALASVSDITPIIYCKVQAAQPLRQSEILTGVVQRRQNLESLGKATHVIDEIVHPYAIVVTQDCDLEQDFFSRFAVGVEAGAKNSQDKQLPSVLLLEAVSVTELLANVSGGELRRRVKKNDDKRFHVLQKIEAAADCEGTGLPALGVDFKRYFTVPTDELYVQIRSNAKRRSYLSSPYMEHLTRRFAEFQSRVALPKDHQLD